MTWIHNPFFHVKPEKLPEGAEPTAAEPEPSSSATASGSATPPPEPPPDDDEEAGLQLRRIISVPHNIRPPTDKMTGYQFFYIFILDGLGAMVLSGGVNFAIAYAMYQTQDIERHPIRLFQLPNTLAGDAAVTIIIQCILTWLVELVLVNRDLRGGHVAPVGFLPQPSNRLLRWFLFLDRGKQRTEPGSWAHWFTFMYSQVLRGFLTAVVCFPLFWPPCVGILTAVGERSGGDWVFAKTWAPQVFKLLLGGLLGLVTTPLFALFWLARCGWAMKTNERHYGEQ